MSLVAGNVTGGGGKATTKKTYRHSVLRETQQKYANIIGADRRNARREQLRNIKSAMSKVYI
jgi:hypothetical protein